MVMSIRIPHGSFGIFGSFPGRLHSSGGIWYNTRHMNKFAISFDLIITLGGCRSAEEVVV